MSGAQRRGQESTRAAQSEDAYDRALDLEHEDWRASRRFARLAMAKVSLMAEDAPSGTQTQTTTAEPRGERLRRRTRRVGLYTWAVVLVALLVVLVALVIANTREVEVSWVFGSTRQSLVWIILAAAIVGWLAGIVTSVLFRRRTRRGH
jgi:uncharacterized integral membrane protein